LLCGANGNSKQEAFGFEGRPLKASSLSLLALLQEDQDWGFVAMVLDRLFLWLFTTASLFGTFSILCEAPAL